MEIGWEKSDQEMSLKTCKKRKTTNCLFVQMNKSWAMDSIIQRIFIQIEFRPKFLENNNDNCSGSAFLSNGIVWFRDWSDLNLNYRASFEHRAFNMLLFALRFDKGREFHQFQCHVFHAIYVNQGQYIIYSPFKDSSICRNVKKPNLYFRYKWKGPSKYAIKGTKTKK